jgi:hypothetical protein
VLTHFNGLCSNRLFFQHRIRGYSDKVKILKRWVRSRNVLEGRKEINIVGIRTYGKCRCREGEKPTTLIFLDLELIHHFIGGNGIGSSTTATLSKVEVTLRLTVSQYVFISSPFWFL